MNLDIHVRAYMYMCKGQKFLIIIIVVYVKLAFKQYACLFKPHNEHKQGRKKIILGYVHLCMYPFSKLHIHA